MWGMKKFADLNDFVRAATRLGMAAIELNHQIRPAMLESLDLSQMRVRSVHEPCPAVISAEELRKKDMLISSLDETRRQQGVDSIKRSIELADRLGAETVVVHAGIIPVEIDLEKKLRMLYDRGLTASAEYLETREQMARQRAGAAEAHLGMVRLSLAELLDYAGRFGVRLALENRYHYFDLPSQDEMAGLLDLADADRLGFLYDVGHAQAMDRLGFFPYELWLKRYGERIFGVHLHDVVGVNDHTAPGRGEVDFRLLAKYLPRDAFRTLEILSSNTPEQIARGLQILVDAGCVNPIQ
jgi:sugar phosphate isomerase/epimerase